MTKRGSAKPVLSTAALVVDLGIGAGRCLLDQAVGRHALDGPVADVRPRRRDVKGMMQNRYLTEKRR